MYGSATTTNNSNDTADQTLYQSNSATTPVVQYHDPSVNDKGIYDETTAAHHNDTTTTMVDGEQKTAILSSIITIVSHVAIIICISVISLYSFILYQKFPANHPVEGGGAQCRYNRIHGFVLVVAILSLFHGLWMILDMVFSIVGFLYRSGGDSDNGDQSDSAGGLRSKLPLLSLLSCSSNGSSIVRFFFQTFISFVFLFLATENWPKRQKCLVEQSDMFHTVTAWLIVCFVLLAIHWLFYVAELIVLRFVTASTTKPTDASAASSSHH